MRWVVDECVDAALVACLRAVGDDVVYLAEVAPAATDADVFALARDDARLLLTEDKDFGDLVYRQRQPTAGLVLLRIHPLLHALKQRRLMAAVARFGETLLGRYTVIEAGRFRSRPLWPVS